jgi:hypothetical protein
MPVAAVLVDILALAVWVLTITALPQGVMGQVEALVAAAAIIVAMYITAAAA